MVRSGFADLDPTVRLAMLKLAETAALGAPEPAPGTVIRIQTPIETPSVVFTPKIRLSLSDYPFPGMDPAAAVVNAGATNLAAQTAPVKLTLSKPKLKVTPSGLASTDVTAITHTLRKLVSRPSLFAMVGDRC